MNRDKIHAAMLAIQEADAALLGMTTWNQTNRTSEAMQAHRKAILALQEVMAQDAPLDLKAYAARFGALASEVSTVFHDHLHGDALKSLEQGIDHALRAKSALSRAEQQHQAWLEGVA